MDIPQNVSHDGPVYAPPPLVIQSSGKKKERTFRVAFGTNRTVETKQEVLEKMFHYPPFNKGAFLCLSELASASAGPVELG